MGRTEISLHQLVSRNNFDMLLSYLQNSKDLAKLEEKDEEGRTPLMAACTDPKLAPIVRLLIEWGAAVNARAPESEKGTPLHFAALSGSEESAQILLSATGINPCIQNDDRRTPFDVASRNGHYTICRLIVTYLAGVSYHSFFGNAYIEKFEDRTNRYEEASLSGNFWVCVVPNSAPKPPRSPKLLLVIYENSMETKHVEAIHLSKCKIKKVEGSKDDWLTIKPNNNWNRYNLIPKRGKLQQLCRVLKGLVKNDQLVFDQVDDMALADDIPQASKGHMNTLSAQGFAKYDMQDPEASNWNTGTPYDPRFPEYGHMGTPSAPPLYPRQQTPPGYQWHGARDIYR